MRSRFVLTTIAAFAVVAASLTVATTAHAGAYPGNKCVTAKLKAASSDCKTVLAAYAKWVGAGAPVDTTTRDDAITKGATKLQASYDKANTSATKQSVNCADMTLDDVGTHALITAAASSIEASVTSGLTLSNAAEAKCGAALVKAAGDLCAALVKDEAGYVSKLSAGTAKRDAANDKADTKFGTSVTNALTGGSCPTSVTQTTLGDAVDELADDVITNHIVSPNVSDTQFDTISPAEYPGIAYQGNTLHPTCSRTGSPYHFFVKRGTVNKLVMYYQGGGACWNGTTCNTVGTFDQEVLPVLSCTGPGNNFEPCTTLANCPAQGSTNSCSTDNPNNTTTGFGDLTNPDNPFKDWNIVFVSYCTGDIHFGDSTEYLGGGANSVHHAGWANSRVAEKFAREHFVAPDEIFVTGSSAGAYGALFNAPLHHDVWPDSKFTVLGDAGNGVITPSFLTNNFPVWNFVAHLPTNIPGVVDSITSGAGMPAYLKAVSDFYPNTAWGNYTSSYDGGTGGQTGFYNVMLNLGNVLEWANWWHSTCAWNTVMRAQALDVAAHSTSNYRYYIGTGSRHTMYGSNKVYTDTTGGVPTIKDWVNSMLARDGGWTNVECAPASSCGVLLSGDPRPSPLAAPFGTSGPDTVITCP